MKKLFVICLLVTISLSYAQGHKSGGKWCCLLKSKGCDSEYYLCPACEKNKKKEKEDKAAEDKRKADVVTAKAEADKKAREIARKEELAEQAEKNKVTEVFVTMPKRTYDVTDLQSKNTDSNNTSITDKGTASYNLKYSDVGIPENTPTYSKSEVTTQAVSYVSNVLNDWNESREKRIANEREEYDRQQSIKTRDRLKEDQLKFKTKYLPLMDKAVNGDENSQMILYFASQSLFCNAFVPQRTVWFDKAAINGNTDALLEKARLAVGEPGINYDFEKGIPYLETAASLGSVDAMLILANWYDKTNTKVMGSKFIGGENAKIALEWYNKAAENGSPNAMYFLGMIYKYGQTPNISGGYGFLRKTCVKYDIVPDEKVAFEWFSKSILPDYVESLYAKSLLYNGNNSFFEESSYTELALLYKKGKVVPKDKDKAKELEKLRKEYTYEIRNRQKIKN